jgi:hypothetical protein
MLTKTTFTGTLVGFVFLFLGGWVYTIYWPQISSPNNM